MQQQQNSGLEDKIDFAAILATQMIKVGLRKENYPKGEGRAILIDFMHNNFKGWNAEMISEAFDMAICGKLDIKDPYCYENFSCEYVARILNAYKQHLILSGKLKSSFELERQYVQPKNQLNAPKMTDDEIIELSYSLWKPFKNWQFISHNAYKILRKKGEIKLTDQEKELFRSTAVAIIANEEIKDPNAYKGLDKKYWIDMYAAKLATAKYFESKNNEK